jgi:hypothetical protein
LRCSFLPGWEIGFSPLALLTAFLCSTFTGVLFGWLPARNAARLDPVDALAANKKIKMPVRRTGILLQDVHNEAESYAAASASTGTITLA